MQPLHSKRLNSSQFSATLRKESPSVSSCHIFRYKNLLYIEKTSGSKCPKKKELDKINRVVELLSEAINVVVAKIGVPGIILPKAIYSFYVYFTTDTQNDAFELSIPLW